ncbi:MAG: DUF2948 family protein [Hyphomicrobiales bacterium]|nr:DUF2948 family protein [Hyphomicrobiales bacterium]
MTAPASTAESLRLVAFDTDDLSVVSAHLQDALVRVGDMAWLPEQDRFALVVSRFDWIAAAEERCERATAGLYFDRVRRAQQTGVPQTTPNVILELLAISFEPTEAPAGRVTLTFCGGAAIRLDVECLEACVRDLGPRWTAKCRPGHALDAEAAPRS